MSDFKIIPDSERPARDAGTLPSEASLALVAGKTLFLPGLNHNQLSRFRTKRSYLARHGFKLHGRSATRDGVKGMIVWAYKP